MCIVWVGLRDRAGRHPSVSSWGMPTKPGMEGKEPGFRPVVLVTCVLFLDGRQAVMKRAASVCIVFICCKRAPVSYSVVKIKLVRCELRPPNHRRARAGPCPIASSAHMSRLDTPSRSDSVSDVVILPHCHQYQPRPSREECDAFMTLTFLGVHAMQQQACANTVCCQDDAIMEFNQWFVEYGDGATLLDCTPEHTLCYIHHYWLPLCTRNSE